MGLLPIRALPARRGARRIAALAVPALLGAALVTAPAASARVTAELSVRSARAAVVDGRLAVDLVAVNRGRHRAQPSLSAVSWRPVDKQGVGRTVVLARVRLGAIRRHGRRTVGLRVALPRAASGAFEVRVCLDIRGKVRERREHDNCRSAGRVVVGAAPAASNGASGSTGSGSGASGARGGAADPATDTIPTPPPDTTPPDTVITGGPAPIVGTRTAELTFHSTERNSRLECRLDGGPWTYCSSPSLFSNLPAGPRRFEVRATDVAGNVDATPAVWTWTVDMVRPDTTITAGPTGDVATAAASVSFTSDDPQATFQCRLDLGAWTACASPLELSGLADGPHTIDVRAVDPAGNEDTAPATRSWNVDTAAPDTTITSGPPEGGDVPAGEVVFEFTSPEAGASFECRLDQGAWTACGTPQSIGTPAAGPHTFEVRALDALGNADATPAARAWTTLAPPDPPPDPGP